MSFCKRNLVIWPHEFSTIFEHPIAAFLPYSYMEFEPAEPDMIYRMDNQRTYNQDRNYPNISAVLPPIAISTISLCIDRKLLHINT
jgi:hypothetical protein